MDVFNVIETQDFIRELQNHCYYISYKLKNPIASRNLYYRVKKRIILLQYFPEVHSKLFLDKNKDLRKMIIGNYIIIYEINNYLKQIYILHIFNGRQNYFNQI